MKRCTRCQSYAINPSQHGRDGTRLDLCDVCFWRDTAETRAARVAEMEARCKRLEEAVESLLPYAEATDDESSEWGPGRWKSEKLKRIIDEARKAKDAKP